MLESRSKGAPRQEPSLIGRGLLYVRASQLAKYCAGKSEYYAIVKAAAQGLHVAAICEDLGLKLWVQMEGKSFMTVEIHSDSSAAGVFESRLRKAET
eukprot:5568491-Amphidinium_carterae.1